MIRHANAPVAEPPYGGLRMGADEFLRLPTDATWYELVDGVVLMSPSPSFFHQKILFEIGAQFAAFLRVNPIGDVAGEVDVRLTDQTVYRPDLVFLLAEKAARCREKVTEIPDVIVEIVAPDSRGFDTKTKRTDYEAAGVGEYWIIDPIRRTMTFLVLTGGKYAEVVSDADRYASNVLAGFELELGRIRAMF